jgi:hypothetical protein
VCFDWSIFGWKNPFDGAVKIKINVGISLEQSSIYESRNPHLQINLISILVFGIIGFVQF